MKKYIFVCLSLFAFLICSSCSDKKDNNYDYHLDVYVGKVIEIVDDNTILLQITQERGGYKVDDKVYVHYDKAEVCLDSDTLKTLNSNYKPVIGDEFNIQSFPEQDYSKIDGYDYRESVGQITMYVSSDWSSQENS